MSKIAILFFSLMLPASIFAAEGQPPPETPYPSGTPPSSPAKDNPGGVSKDHYGATSKDKNLKTSKDKVSTLDSIREEEDVE